MMALILCQTGLCSGIARTSADYTIYCGEWGVGRMIRPVAAPTICAGFGRSLSIRPDDALRSCVDVGGGQGAVPEELGRLEGVGGAGRG